MTDDTIFLDELDCPYCVDNYDLYNEADVAVAVDQYRTTKVVCDGCGKEFIVTTSLTIHIAKPKGGIA